MLPDLNNQPLNSGFSLVEDEALKAKLQGIVVRTATGTSPVDVRFRVPERDQANVRYPFISIDLVGIERARDGREHRGWIDVTSNPPPGAPMGVDTKQFSMVTDYPIPIDLIYQVTAFARNAQHDRAITIALLTWAIPERFGSLYIPEFNVVSRLDYLGYVEADTYTPEGKRNFRKIHTVSVSSEIYPSQIWEVQKTGRVAVNVTVPNVIVPIEIGN